MASSSQQGAASRASLWAAVKSAKAAKPTSAKSVADVFSAMAHRRAAQPKLSGLSGTFRTPAKAQAKAAAVAAGVSQPKASGDAPLQGEHLTAALIEDAKARRDLDEAAVVGDSARKRKRLRYNNSRREAKAACKRPSSTKRDTLRMDTERTGNLLSSQCQCSRETCFVQLQEIEEEFRRVLSMYCDCDKGTRDAILLRMGGSKQFGVLGKVLSPPCFRKLFMLGKARVQGASKGELNPDRRLRGQAKLLRQKPMDHICRAFLVDLYCNLGETLPHRYHGKWYKRRKRSLSGLDSDSVSDEEDVPRAAEEDTREEVLATKNHFTRWVESGLGTDIATLPLRYLPPGNVLELYTQMCATSSARRRPSYTTFMRVWKDFERCLRFRQKGEFAECDQCSELKAAIKKAKKSTAQEVLDATHTLKQHYLDVAKSRDLETQLRNDPSTLVIVMDGMDQSHWAIPRLPGFKGPKKFANPKLTRPRAKVEGVWCFWRGVHFMVADQNQPHDSSFTCECLLRCLEHVKRRAEAEGKDLPRSLIIISDNTVRENKNNQMLHLMSTLVAKNMFDLTGMFFHQKGHTHNCLDQVFGVISRLFQHCDVLRDLQDVADQVLDILKRPSMQDFLTTEGESITVEIVEGVRDFKEYFEPLGIHFEGGMRDDKSGMHCFLFMCRKDVPPAAQRDIVVPATGAGRSIPSYTAHLCDVVMLTKRFSFDTDICGPPRAVMPHVLFRSLREHLRWPPAHLRPAPVKQKLKEGCLLCADALLETFEPSEMQRSVAYLRALASGERGEATQLPRLRWYEMSSGHTGLEAAARHEVKVLQTLAPAVLTRVAMRPRPVEE